MQYKTHLTLVFCDLKDKQLPVKLRTDKVNKAQQICKMHLKYLYLTMINC